MGIISKIKNIFFDDEEDTEVPEYDKEKEISFDDLGDDEETKTETKSFMHRFKKEHHDDDDDDDDEVKTETKPFMHRFKKEHHDDDDDDNEEKKERDTKELPVFEKEPKKESSPFVAFDDDEFENNVVKTTRTTSTIKLETKKDGTQKLEYKKYEINEEPTSKKNFRVSPIISPVYGILDKNYVKEDFLPKFKKEGNKNSNQPNVDTIRNKAFGSLVDDIESTIEEIPTDNYEDDAPAGKTIDELLLENDIEEVDTTNKFSANEEDNDFSIEEAINNAEYEIEVTEDNTETSDSLQNRLEQTSALEILDEIEKSLDKTKDSKNKLEDDTFENDLFELIDSMYEDRKDGSK